MQYLGVRNDTLRRKGLPITTIAFIKLKADMFYNDMYGSGVNVKDFKCSNGWVHRFKERYKDILDPVDTSMSTSTNADTSTVGGGPSSIMQQHDPGTDIQNGDSGGGGNHHLMENVPPITDDQILRAGMENNPPAIGDDQLQVTTGDEPLIHV